MSNDATRIYSDFGGAKAILAATLDTFNRNELLLITFAVASLSAIISPAKWAIEKFGFLSAIGATFNVSVIVWAAIWLGLSSLAHSRPDVRATRRLTLICYTVIALSFLPIGASVWVLITALGFYLIVFERDDQDIVDAGWVFMALTVPEFWGKRVFNFFSDFILQVDAIFVSTLTGTSRVGNLVEMPGGGSMIIAGPCSSMANISLSVLCWMLFSQYNIGRWSPWNWFWCLSAAIAIMAINVTRITIIGFFPAYYDFLHDGGGVVIFSWISAVVAVAVCYVGVRHANSQKG